MTLEERVDQLEKKLAGMEDETRVRKLVIVDSKRRWSQDWTGCSGLKHAGGSARQTDSASNSASVTDLQEPAKGAREAGAIHDQKLTLNS